MDLQSFSHNSETMAEPRSSQSNSERSTEPNTFLGTIFSVVGFVILLAIVMPFALRAILKQSKPEKDPIGQVSVDQRTQDEQAELDAEATCRFPPKRFIRLSGMWGALSVPNLTRVYKQLHNCVAVL